MNPTQRDGTRVAIVEAIAVPPVMLGTPPPTETVRQRADYIKAMSKPMGLDAYEVADRDPAVQQLLARDLWRQP